MRPGNSRSASARYPRRRDRPDEAEPAPPRRSSARPVREKKASALLVENVVGASRPCVPGTVKAAGASGPPKAQALYRDPVLKCYTSRFQVGSHATSIHGGVE